MTAYPLVVASLWITAFAFLVVGILVHRSIQFPWQRAHWIMASAFALLFLSILYANPLLAVPAAVYAAAVSLLISAYKGWWTRRSIKRSAERQGGHRQESGGPGSTST